MDTAESAARKVGDRAFAWSKNLADLLTRTLPRERFGRLSRLLGMRSSRTSSVTALPTEANEIGMLDAFEVVEPHCQHCGEFFGSVDDFRRHYLAHYSHDRRKELLHYWVQLQEDMEDLRLKDL